MRFATIERRLAGFLGALWNTYPKLEPKPAAAPVTPARPSFAPGVIRLPDPFRGHAPNDATPIHYAAIAHAGAHLCFTPERLAPGTLKPIQLVLIALIEDARVEHLAIRAYPGLRRLFQPFHIATPAGGTTAAAYLTRLARALFDPDYVDGDSWVEKGRALFHAADPASPAISRVIGNLLGNDFGQMRIGFDARTHTVEPAYRDDNSGLWTLPDHPPGEPASETWLDAAKLAPSDTEPPSGPPDPNDSRPANAARPAAPTEYEVPPLATYPEWDHLIRQFRPGFATIRAHPPRLGRAAEIDAILAEHAPLARRLTALIDRARVSRPHRLRRQLNGEAIDLDACINAMIDLRAGLDPDPRIHSRTERRSRDLATLVLIDVSQSTNDPLAGTPTSILTLERAAAALLAEAMTALSDRFALRAFCSNGRTDVRYAAIKDFAAPFDLDAKRKLAGLTGGLSTRLGAAIRHAGHELAAERTHRRLLLIMSDGAPADIDIGSPTYLVEDARHAVQELALKGIDAFGIGLDPTGRATFAHIFGRKRSVVVERLEHLPETLTRIYLRLTA